jgi:putative aldouronate transport system substrate-binding protein
VAKAGAARRGAACAALLALALAASGLTAGCGNGAGGGGATAATAATAAAGTAAPAAEASAATAAAAAKPDKVEIKIYAPGDRPVDMDKVLDAIEAACPDDINVKPNLVFIPWGDLADKTQLALTSGEDIDFIFDAPWLHMDQMISQGMYKVLDEYIDRHGQNLIATRGDTMWDANKWDGHVYGICFGDTYGGGSRTYYLRKDLREALGIGPIESHEDVVAFLYAVRDNMPDVIPYSMDKGALDNNWSSFYVEQQFERTGVGHGFGAAGSGYLIYTVGPDSTELKNILDEPNDVIVGAWREARQLYLDKVINPDILADNRTGEAQFVSGKIASYVSNSGAVSPDMIDDLRKNVPDGDIETFTEFSYKPGIEASDFKVYNFQCAPKNAKNTERAVAFLDWANSSQEIYDLFAYGIEGENWTAVGDKQYTPLEGYGYFPYVWVMNPAQQRYDARYTQKDMDALMYVTKPENFVKSVRSGFSFNSETLATEMAIVSEVETKYMPALGHGVLDPDETLAKIRDEAYEAIVKIQGEIQRQVDEFVSANPQ